MDMTTVVEDQGDWTVVHVHGDIDMATAPRLRGELVGLATAGRSRLILDLEQVDFVDSLGLGVIVGALRRARSQGGDLLLVSTRRHLRSTLEITGLIAPLPPHQSVEAAIDGHGSRS